MATLTPLKAAGSATGEWTGVRSWSRLTGSWTDNGAFGLAAYVPDALDEAITASAANGDTAVGLPAGANLDATVTIPLTNPDADFSTMDTLSIRYSSAERASPDDYVDDTYDLRVEVRNGALTLAAYSSGGTFQGLDYFDGTDWTDTSSRLLDGTTAQGGSGTAPGYDKTVAFNYVNTTATKAQWDGAVIDINWSDTRSMGSDSAAGLLVDFELTGTYTTAGLSATVNQVTETQTAQSITVDPQHRLVGQVTETDTAQAVSVDPQHRLISQASETELAQPVTVVKAYNITVNQVTETETAQPVTVDATFVRAIGQVTETELAQNVSVRKIVTVNQITETETAQPVTVASVINRTVNQVTETELAQSVTAAVTFVRSIGQAAETELSQAVSSAKTKTVSQAEDSPRVTDDFNRANSSDLGADWTEVSGDFSISGNALSVVAGQLQHNTTLQPNQYVESDFSSFSGTMGLLLRWDGNDIDTSGVAYEVRYDGLSWSILRWGSGVSNTLDNGSTAPGSITSMRGEVQGDTIRLYANGSFIASVTDTVITGAGSVGYYNTSSTRTADNFEAGSLAAQPIQPLKTVSVAQVSESDTAQAVTVDPIHRLIGQAAETETAQTITPALSGGQDITVNQVSESDVAQSVTAVKTVQVGQVSSGTFDVENDVAWHSLFWAEGTEFKLRSYADGGDVAVWDNETGETDADNESTPPPSFDEVNASFNNRSTVHFDGAEKIETWGFSTSPTYTNGVTFAVVAKMNAVDGTTQSIFDSHGPLSSRNTLYVGSGNNWAIHAGSGSPAGGTADTDAHLFIVYFDGSTGNDYLDIDGVSEISGSDAGSNQINGLALGSNYDGNTRAEVDIALVGIFDGVLVDDSSWSDFAGWVEHYYNIDVSGVTASAGRSDIAQPVSVLKTVSVGQVSETETAQPITVVVAGVVGQASETDTAQPVSVLKTVSVGQATESDTAQAVVADVTHVRSISQVSETDTAQAVTADVTFVRNIGQATETDTAQTITVQGQSVVTVNQVVDTQTAQAVTPAKIVRVRMVNSGETIEMFDSFTDTSGTLLSAHTSDSGDSWTAATNQLKIHPDGGSAWPNTNSYNFWNGVQLSGNDGRIEWTMWLNNKTNSRGMGVAFYTASSVTTGWGTSDNVIMTEVSRSLIRTTIHEGGTRRNLDGQTSTNLSPEEFNQWVRCSVQWNTAEKRIHFTVVRLKDGTILHDDDFTITSLDDGLVAPGSWVGVGAYRGDTDTKFGEFRASTFVPTDIAQSITPVKAFNTAVNQAAETDTAQAITVKKQKAVQSASETDAARTVTPVKTVTVSQVTESDSVFTISVAKTKDVTQVSETELAQAVTAIKAQSVALGQAVETELAQSVTIKITASRSGTISGSGVLAAYGQLTAAGTVSRKIILTGLDRDERRTAISTQVYIDNEVAP